MNFLSVFRSKSEKEMKIKKRKREIEREVEGIALDVCVSTFFPVKFRLIYLGLLK